MANVSNPLGWWVFGTAAMFYVFWILAGVGLKRAKRLGQDVYRTYLYCGVLTLFVWMLYPVAWGVSEGANLISPDSEAVFYGVLDFLAKPVFSILLVMGHWNIEPERFGLSINYGDELVAAAGPRHTGEKGIHGDVPATATTTGTATNGATHHTAATNESIATA